MEVHEIYQIAELISACIRGEILPAEKQQILDRWIKASEENQKLYALKDCKNVQIRENKENLTLR